LVPINVKVKSIKVMFNLPSDWQLVTPYIDQGTYFEVPKITNDLVRNFVQRQGIYFGKFTFYSEMLAGNSIIKFGVLESDQSWGTQIHLSTQEDVNFYVQRTALAVERYTEIFGENPYPVIPLYTNFSPDFIQTYRFPGTRESTGGYQYWPPTRYDELVGHLILSWVSFANDYRNESLVSADRLIAKGLGEYYIGNRLAYEITGDRIYLGKIYSSYLVYKRALNTQYMSIDEIGNTYYKGAVIGLYLDSLIQQETENTKSIYDVFGYLYKKYKNSEHIVSITDLQEAVNAITNKDNSVVFNKYVYGNEEIPVQDIIQPYKDSFGAFLEVLGTDAWTKNYQGYTIPFFIDIEMSIPLSSHIPFGLLIDNYYQQFAEYMINNYDIDKLTKEDVDSSLNILTGRNSSGFFERWKDSYEELSLEEMKDWLKGYSSTPSGSHGFTVAPLALGNSAINLDGISSDWPEISPLATDPQESGPYDFAALYAFSDENYLYLRIDPYGSFSSDVPGQFTFDIVAEGENQGFFQAFTIPNQPEDVHLAPQGNNGLQWDLQKIYKGAALDQIFELIIPLEYLGYPDRVTIHAYINRADQPTSFDSFYSVEYAITTATANITITPLSIPSPIGTNTPTSTPTTTPTGQPVESSSSNPLWVVLILGVVAILIGGVLLRKKRR